MPFTPAEAFLSFLPLKSCPSYNCISIDTFSISILSLLIRSDSDARCDSFELLQYFILLLSVLWVFIYLSLLKTFKHLMSYNCVILKPTWVWSSALLLINVTLGHLLNVPKSVSSSMEMRKLKPASHSSVQQCACIKDTVICSLFLILLFLPLSTQCFSRILEILSKNLFEVAYSSSLFQKGGHWLVHGHVARTRTWGPCFLFVSNYCWVSKGPWV